MARLAERLDAALNPLMVKEAHQSFRNRLVIGAGVLALGVPLIMFSVALITRSFDESSEATGRAFFGTLSGFFGMIALLIVPARATQQFQAEIKSRTIDLILLTGLSPWELASGRFQAAGLQLVLMLAFIAPFAVVSTLMGGIALDSIVPSLFMLLLIGLMQSAAGLLAISTTLVSRRLGAVALLLFAVQLLLSMSTALWLVELMPRTKLGMVAWTALLVSLNTLLFLRLSADMITPPAQRSFAHAKLIMWALLGVFLLPLWTGGSSSLASSSKEQTIMLAFALSWFTAFSLMWSAAAMRPSSGGRLGVWLADGYAPTLLYAVATMALIGGVASVRGWPAWIALIFPVYLTFFVGLAALFQTFWFVRSAEGFFAGVAICVVVDVLGVAWLEAGHDFSLSRPMPLAAVFLPISWADSPERVLQPWFAAPAAVGALAMLVAYRRRVKLPHG